MNWYSIFRMSLPTQLSFALFTNCISQFASSSQGLHNHLHVRPRLSTLIQLKFFIGLVQWHNIWFLGCLWSGLSGPFLFCTWHMPSVWFFWTIPRWLLPAVQHFGGLHNRRWPGRAGSLSQRQGCDITYDITVWYYVTSHMISHCDVTCDVTYDMEKWMWYHIWCVSLSPMISHVISQFFCYDHDIT